MAGQNREQTIAEHLAAAQQAIQSGELERAVTIYCQILLLDPGNPLANYWLGVIDLKSAGPNRAIRRLEMAAVKLGNVPDVQIDLGLAYAAAGDKPRATAAFQKARALAPDYAAVQLRLAATLEKRKQRAEAIEACVRGRVLFPHHLPLLKRYSTLCIRSKRWEDALKAWRTVLAERPECLPSHMAFGESCFEAGDFELAASTFSRAAQIKPGFAMAHANLGLTLQRLGATDQAVENFRLALSLDPDDSRIYHGYGDLLRELRRWPEATAAWATSVDLRPNNAAAWQNLGLGLEHMERLEEALACHQRVLQLRPNDATAHRYLGMLHQDMGNIAAAETSYREASSLDPNDPEVQWQLFEIMAFRGQFPAAWDAYESRWKLKRTAAALHNFKQPFWAGESAPTATLLLHAEQGFGDTIQIVRFIAMARQRVGTVLLWVQPSLLSLMKSVEGATQVLFSLTPELNFDFHLPLMSLPRVFGTTLETLPNAFPYLHPPAGTAFFLPEPKPGAVKIGLVWCGSRSQDNDRRPVPLEIFKPLLDRSDAQFYSLQLGSAVADLANLTAPGAIVDLSERLVDFGATAAAIAQLDLVISVDTATAHLAGALGKPVWILLSFRPDWRWLFARQDSPWYSSARLFRQSQSGTWPEVMERISTALDTFVKERTRSQKRDTELIRRGANSPASSANSDPSGTASAEPHVSTKEFEPKKDMSRATAGASTDPRALLGAGLVHHQAGRLEEAEECYRRVLAVDNSNAGCWRVLGVSMSQRGKLAEARECLDRSLQLDPNSSEAHQDRGLVDFQTENLEGAIGWYRKALALDPTMGDVYYNLGNALYAAKQIGKAIDAYEKALQHSPGLAEAHYNLGLICQQQNQASAAVAHYQRALNCAPNRKEYLLNLSTAQRDCGQIDGAFATLETLFKIDPTHAEGRVNYSSLLVTRGELDRAQSICEDLLHQAVRPNTRAGDIDRARLGTILNLGVIAQASGNVARAADHFQEVLSLEPANADAEYNLGIAELLGGRFQSGWKHYEARWRTRNSIFARRAFSQPLWKGENLEGKSILVHGEQGLGDTIQFARFIPWLARLGATVILECQPGLRRLFTELEGATGVIVRGDSLPQCDFHCPLMSLPRWLNPDPEKLASNVPYIKIPSSVSASIGSGPRVGSAVGIAWAGRPEQDNDRNRSIPFDALSSLWSCSGVVWHSLQVGPSTREAESVKSIINLAPQFTDFAVTGAAIQQLDLIVSADTAVAHLAGALGRPVCLLLPFAPDWRWLLNRSDSPWYPTMTLFRQPSRGDWKSVIQQVVAELERPK